MSAKDSYAVIQDGVEQRSGDLRALRADSSTALAALVAEHLDLPPVEIRLASASPRGAGLGASSALTVALLAASEIFRSGALELSEVERATVARDLEARLMALPTGLQDHLPGQLGGALAIHHQPGGQRIERLEIDLDSLAECLVVAYTGQSHFSAGNNWSVLCRRFEAHPDTVERFERIARVAAELRRELLTAAWSRVGELLAEEWEARSGLAAEVTTPQLEQLLGLARREGAWGGKACGAGGGGSIAVLAPADRRERVASALAAAGARVLSTRPTRSGLAADAVAP